MWDYDEHLSIVLNIEGGSPSVKNRKPDKTPRDKNWTGFEQVYYVVALYMYML